MKKGRLVRHILEMPSAEHTKKLTWMEGVLKIILADPHLSQGQKKIREAQARNDFTIPVVEVIVDTFGNKEEIHHQQLWKHRTKQWLHRKELADITTRTGSTLRLMARETDGINELPPTQLRLRMLAGTSALNCTLSTFRNRELSCPW